MRFESGWRAALGLAAAAASAWLAVSGLRAAVDASGVEGAAPRTAVLQLIDLRLRRLAEREGAGGAHALDIVHFGDSNVYDGQRGTELQQHMTGELRRRRPRARVRIYPVANPGMDAFAYRFVAQCVAEARPNAVLLALNPASLTPAWTRRFAFPELAALAPPRDWFPLFRLPIERADVSLDSLIVEWAALRLGGLKPWLRSSRFQIRVNELPTWLDERLFGGAAARLDLANMRHGLRERHRGMLFGEGGRYTAAGYRTTYALGPRAERGADASNPVLQALGATARTLRAAGIPVLVYATPVNTQDMHNHAPDVLIGLKASLESAAAVAVGAGATWLDLHARHPDPDFADAPSHLRGGEEGSPYQRHAVDLSGALLGVLARGGN